MAFDLCHLQKNLPPAEDPDIKTEGLMCNLETEENTQYNEGNLE